jgi:RNA polymerase sigma factor (sigma-70 family)
MLVQVKQYIAARLSGTVGSAEHCGAWDPFYRACSDSFATIARRLRLRPEQEKDAFQECWIRLLHRLPDLADATDGDSLRSWLYKVMWHIAIDLLRRETRRPDANAISLTQVDVDELLSAWDEGPAHAWNQEFLLWALAQLKSKLSDLNFRMLRMRLLEQATVAEIATSVGLAARRVTYRLRRMHRMLHALYTDQVG